MKENCGKVGGSGGGGRVALEFSSVLTSKQSKVSQPQKTYTAKLNENASLQNSIYKQIGTNHQQPQDLGGIYICKGDGS